MDNGLDYDVQTRIQFLLDFDGEGSLNALAFPTIHQQFAEHVCKIYEQDDTLSWHLSGNLNFAFDGPRVTLEYTFSCHDENTAEAESFSVSCVQDIRKRLEGFGCKIKGIRCKAEEADMTLVDQLEDAIFGPRHAPPNGKSHVSPSPKKGKKRSGQER